MQVLTDSYIEKEQSNTKFNLKRRILNLHHNYPKGENDIVVEFDAPQLNDNNFHLLTQLPEIINNSGEVGEFELDIFKITISSMETYEHTLILIEK
jgi:hypothetical protein